MVTEVEFGCGWAKGNLREFPNCGNIQQRTLNIQVWACQPREAAGVVDNEEGLKYNATMKLEIDGKLRTGDLLAPSVP